MTVAWEIDLGSWYSEVPCRMVVAAKSIVEERRENRSGIDTFPSSSSILARCLGKSPWILPRGMEEIGFESDAVKL